MEPATRTNRNARSALALLLVAVAFCVTTESGASAASGPRLTVNPVDPGDSTLLSWAVDRFDLAGLQLPELIVTFHEDTAGCNGSAGLYRHGTPGHVHICVSADRPALTRKLITLHELGHAWAENPINEATRVAFLEERGVDTWHHPDQAPHLWGAEHAAETISWALMDEPVQIIRIYDAAPEQLSSAFRLLTGCSPLNPSV